MVAVLDPKGEHDIVYLTVTNNLGLSMFVGPCLELYWVTGQNVAQETEKWAEWAALASAADSAHSSVSCKTSSLVTQYSSA